MFATGVCVATVRASDGTPHGLTVSSFTSVSIQPPLILICIDYAFNFLSHFRACSNFAVNILSETQRDLSVTFAVKPEGRFEGVDWHTNVTGAPLLHGCIANQPAHIVEARVNLDPPHELIVTGQVEETGLFFPHLC